MAYLIPGKIIAILVFLIGTFLCAYSPFMFKGLRKSPGALGIINAFGGGLFLAGGIIHILPEALRKMDEWYKPVEDDDHRLRFLAEAAHAEEETVEHFPWPAFGASIIFCLQLMLEKTVGRTANASWLFAAGMGLHATFAGLALGLEKSSGSFIALMIGILSHKFSESIAVGVKIFEEVKPGQIQRYLEVEKMKNDNSSTAEKTKNEEVQVNQVSPLEDSPLGPKFGQHPIEQFVEVLPKTPDSNFFPLKLLDLVDAPKVTKPEPSKSVKVMSYIVLGLFIITTPLGICIGIAVSDVNKWAESFLLGLSAGTFIYTGTIHVIPEEFDGKKNLWLKTLAYVLGVGVICGVWFIEHKAFPHESH
jgi:zinc transporter ZupT